MVGIIPALASAVIDGDMLNNAMTMNKNFTRLLASTRASGTCRS